jgi:hypothetical protein
MERLPLCVLSITKRLPNQITVNTHFCYSFIITFTNANVNLPNMKKETYQDFAS